MSDIRPALAILIKHEGGFVNHPKDPGGATKYGISLRFLRKQQHISGDIDGDGDIDADDIKKLKSEHYEILYKQDFWDKLRLDKIQSQKVANMVFGLCVNMGPKAAITLLQKAVCMTSSKIAIDGDFGPQTINAVNSLDDHKLILAYKLEAVKFYRSIAEKNQNLKAFLYGWLRRVNSY